MQISSGETTGYVYTSPPLLNNNPASAVTELFSNGVTNSANLSANNLPFTYEAARNHAIRFNDRYNTQLQITGRFTAEISYDNPESGKRETAKIWGDPHIDMKSGDGDFSRYGDFWNQSTFVTPGGIKFNFETKPWEGNTDMTVTSSINVTVNPDKKRSYGIDIEGIDSKNLDNLKVTAYSGKAALQFDAENNDGQVLLHSALTADPNDTHFALLNADGSTTAYDGSFQRIAENEVQMEVFSYANNPMHPDYGMIDDMLASIGLGGLRDEIAFIPETTAEEQSVLLLTLSIDEITYQVQHGNIDPNHPDIRNFLAKAEALYGDLKKNPDTLPTWRDNDAEVHIDNLGKSIAGLHREVENPMDNMINQLLQIINMLLGILNAGQQHSHHTSGQYGNSMYGALNDVTYMLQSMAQSMQQMNHSSGYGHYEPAPQYHRDDVNQDGTVSVFESVQAHTTRMAGLQAMAKSPLDYIAGGRPAH